MAEAVTADGPVSVTGGLRLLLRLEGFALFTGAVLLYAFSGGSWLLFAALLLAPDLSFAGYLAGARFGAACYNILHTTIGPLALGVAGLILAWSCRRGRADLACAYRHRPRAGLRAEIRRRLRLHPSRPHRPRDAANALNPDAWPRTHAAKSSASS